MHGLDSITDIKPPHHSLKKKEVLLRSPDQVPNKERNVNAAVEVNTNNETTENHALI